MHNLAIFSDGKSPKGSKERFRSYKTPESARELDEDAASVEGSDSFPDVSADNSDKEADSTGETYSEAVLDIESNEETALAVVTDDEVESAVESYEQAALAEEFNMEAALAEESKDDEETENVGKPKILKDFTSATPLIHAYGDFKEV